MQSVGVISPVDEPSPWCAGMIKPLGDERICVGSKPGVLQESHFLPLTQLAGAAVFSKLDANGVFWYNPTCQ